MLIVDKSASFHFLLIHIKLMVRTCKLLAGDHFDVGITEPAGASLAAIGTLTCFVCADGWQRIALPLGSQMQLAHFLLQSAFSQ